MIHTPDNGGPAFPTPQDEFGKNSPSMSLRDYFAGQALVGILAASGETFDDLARRHGTSSYSALAYISADAMLAARKGGAA